MGRVSDFTRADEEYLDSQHALFRATPGSEKEAFRERCAKHILAVRGRLPDDSETWMYIFENFTMKVRYWFQNHAPVKKTALPLAINHAFHPERVWGMKHKNDIRTGLQESIPDNVDADAPYVVQWNAKRKELWQELTDEEKLIYQRLADEWSVHGPDDDLKPDMAERRAVSWMKAVALLFWQQCRMPIFIYGCFEDTKAQLQGATFDTSLLFEDTDEWRGKPTFRASKDWATDFRRYFYEFFTAYIRPDLASPDAMEYLRTTSKRVVDPFDFERAEDGWPLLPKAEKANTQRRQEILRLWLRQLYGYACGSEQLAVPWTSVTRVPAKFFDPGMLPPNFSMGDPSHIPREPLKTFYDHVHDIQNGKFPEIPRFQFAHFETGPENNRSYPDAINTCDVTPWQPRRAKKKVKPPTFDAPPGNTDDEGGADAADDADQENPTAKSKKNGTKRGMFNPGKKFYKQVEKLRKEKERAIARKDKADAKAAKKQAKASAKKGKGKAKAKAYISDDDGEWNTDDEDTTEEEEIEDFEAIDHDVPLDESEESGEEAPLSHSREVPGDASDDSGDEVEDVLERYEDVLSSSAVRRSATTAAAGSGVVFDSVSALQAARQAIALPSSPVGDQSSPPPPDALRPTTQVEATTRPAKTDARATPHLAPSAGPSRRSSHSNRPTTTPTAPPKRSDAAAPKKRSAVAGSKRTSTTETSKRTQLKAATSKPVADVDADDQVAAAATDTSPAAAPAAVAPAAVAPATAANAAAGAATNSSSTAATISAERPAVANDTGEHCAADESTLPVADDAVWQVPRGQHLAPADVPANGSARYQYLRSLDQDNAYLNMLERAKSLLSQTAAIRVKPPLFWASWGHKSPFLPRDAHIADKGPKTVQAILNFLKKGIAASCKAADAQRYCLVMGLVLKNIATVQFLDPGDDWPPTLPQYMEGSPLTFDMREPLLAMCGTLFLPSADITSPEASASRPKRKGKQTVADVANPDVASSSEPAEASTPAPEDNGLDPGPSVPAGGKKQRKTRAAAGDGPGRATRSAGGAEHSSAAGPTIVANPAPTVGARRSSRLRK